MGTSVHFATTRRAELRPVSCNGILVCECHEQLTAIFETYRDMLAQAGMKRPDLVLAEPVFSKEGDDIDWYAPGTASPVPVESLDPAERARSEAGLAVCARALNQLVERLREEATSPVMVDVLKSAFIHPRPSDLYALDGCPVLVNWGMTLQKGRGEPENILRFRATPTPPTPGVSPVSQAPEAGDAAPAAPAPVFTAPVAVAPAAAAQAAAVPDPAPEPITQSVADSGSGGGENSTPPPPAGPTPEPVPAGPPLFPGCLSWFLPLFLLALLLWLLLAALGCLPSPLPASCFHEEVSRHGEDLRSRTLDDEEAKLLGALRERAGQCRPRENSPEADAARDRDLAERTPVLPDFSGLPEEPRGQSGDALNIPADAAQRKDYSFLEGCWQTPELGSSLTGRRIDLEYCFNRRGRGEVIIQDGRATCRGALSASFTKEGHLVMKSRTIRCGNGVSFSPNRILCQQGEDGKTYCKGVNESDGSAWDARFTRR